MSPDHQRDPAVEALIADALNAADRVSRYRRLRTFVVILSIVAVVSLGFGAYSFKATNQRLCDRSIENRQALHYLAHQALDPIPTRGLSDEFVKLIAERAAARAALLSEFLHKYPAASC